MGLLLAVSISRWEASRGGVECGFSQDLEPTGVRGDTSSTTGRFESQIERMTRLLGL